MTGLAPQVSEARAERHPCFSARAASRFGRIHLPVAASCNIKCAYCDRRCDCVNESRPGVTSRLMTPEEAADHLRESLRRAPFISVVGVAGPGDPFARPQTTLETLRLVRAERPDLALCISTNGLAVGEHVRELADLGVGFVTVTVNAVDPAVGRRIYEHVLVDNGVDGRANDRTGGGTDGGRTGQRRLEGTEAAGLLMERQLAAVAALKAAGLTVKINVVVVPGVNDAHAPAIARRMAGLGADLMNLIGLIPVSGTPMADVAPPSPDLMERLRRDCSA